MLVVDVTGGEPLLGVADRMDDEKAEVDVGAEDELLVVGSELVVLLLIVVEVVLGLELVAAGHRLERSIGRTCRRPGACRAGAGGAAHHRRLAAHRTPLTRIPPTNINPQTTRLIPHKQTRNILVPRRRYIIIRESVPSMIRLQLMHDPRILIMRLVQRIILIRLQARLYFSARYEQRAAMERRAECWTKTVESGIAVPECRAAYAAPGVW